MCDVITRMFFLRLYNKEAVLMALLDKSNMPDIAKHIRSLKVTYTASIRLWCHSLDLLIVRMLLSFS